jgi:hypothetical protein
MVSRGGAIIDRIDGEEVHDADDDLLHFFFSLSIALVETPPLVVGFLFNGERHSSIG